MKRLPFARQVLVPSVTKLSLILLFCTVTTLLSGCVKERQYQQLVQPPPALTFEPVPQPAASSPIAVIEFKSTGEPWSNCKTTNPCQQTYALNLIERARQNSEGKHIVVVTFVHGWHNNADSKSPNLESFHEMVECLNSGKLAYLKAHSQYNNWRKALNHLPCAGDTPPENVRYIGIYIGWPGKARPGLLDYFSLTSRQSVADAIVEQGALISTFRLIREAAKGALDTQAPEAHLIIVGHSLGGRVVEGVAAKVIGQTVAAQNPEDFADCPAGDPNSRGYKPFADEMFLINPANTAIVTKHLIELFKSHSGDFCHNPQLADHLYRPFLVSIHSRSDIWTGREGTHLRHLSPAGQAAFGTNFPPNNTYSQPVPSDKLVALSTAGDLPYLDSLCYVDSSFIRRNHTGSKTGELTCDRIATAVRPQKAAAYAQAGMGAITAQGPDPGAYEVVTQDCSTTKPKYLCLPRDVSKQRAVQTDMAAKISYLAFPGANYKGPPAQLLNLYTRLDLGCKAITAPSNDLKPVCGPEPDDIAFQPDSNQLGKSTWNNTPYWIFNVPYGVVQGHTGYWNSEMVGLVDQITRSFTLLVPTTMSR
jgi:hypothetical protein